jgi:hypothetical protein
MASFFTLESALAKARMRARTPGKHAGSGFVCVICCCIFNGIPGLGFAFSFLREAHRTRPSRLLANAAKWLRFVEDR